MSSGVACGRPVRTVHKRQHTAAGIVTTLGWFTCLVAEQTHRRPANSAVQWKMIRSACNKWKWLGTVTHFPANQVYVSAVLWLMVSVPAYVCVLWRQRVRALRMRARPPDTRASSCALRCLCLSHWPTLILRCAPDRMMYIRQPCWLLRPTTYRVLFLHCTYTHSYLIRTCTNKHTPQRPNFPTSSSHDSTTNKKYHIIEALIS